MASVAVEVMAHPQRRHLVGNLVDRLALTGREVTWDRGDGVWDTGRRAMLAAAGRGAEWALVVQDDAIVCRELAFGLEQILDLVPRRMIVSLFTGHDRPMPDRVRRAVTLAERDGASWLQNRGVLWGVAIAVPSASVPAMAAWADRATWPAYDRRLGQYYKRHGWHARYTVPSLVDHRDTDSLTGHDPGRVAHRFIGEDASAFGVRWNDRVVHI